MKFIATFLLAARSVTEATERHEAEFYRRPANAINGRRLGYYAKTPTGMVRTDYSGHPEGVEMTPWETGAVGALFEHLEVHRATTPGRGYEDILEVGAGYTAFISGDQVVAETYVASSGNCVILVHDREGGKTTLAIDSRRHGIPMLANIFREVEPEEVVMYESLRTDRPWWEVDLTAAA